MSLGGDDRKAGAAGVLHQPRLEPRLKAGLRLRRCQPGTQPAEDLHPARWTVEDVVDAGDGLRVHGRGHPQIGHGADVDAVPDLWMPTSMYAQAIPGIDDVFDRPTRW